MHLRAELLILVGAAMAASPALAGDGERRARDPNEVICEKQTVLGTRLAIRKVCGTRAEWDEKRRLDKEAIDKAQTQIGVIKI